MISRENMLYSLRNIWQRKSRSALTVLSMFVGIVSIFIFISFLILKGKDNNLDKY